MGLFDRISGRLGGEEADALEGLDRGANTERARPDDDRKAGSHGTHWDALLDDDDSVAEAVVTAVRDGAAIEGRPVDGDPVTGYLHPVEAAVRTCAVARRSDRADDGAGVAGNGTGTDVTLEGEGTDADTDTDADAGELVTAYPVVAGTTHRATLVDVVEWATDVEAQLRLDVAGHTLGAFDTGYFARGEEYAVGEDYDVSLALFAYDVALAEGAVTDDDGRPVPSADAATFEPLDGGDLDDVVFRSVVGERGVASFAGHAVDRIQCPLFRTGDGEDVDVAVYAGEGVLSGDPDIGDDIEGVGWLTARVVG
jgi:hypothetical protein